MKFQIIDDNENSILGTITEENVYIRSYAVFPEKHARDLKVDESCPVNYSLSGESGSYRILRVE